MKRFLRLSLSLLALMLVFGGFAITETKAQSALQKILNTMDAHNKALTSLQADIMMVKDNTQIGESDTTSGTMMYIPKSPKNSKIYARIDWKKPIEESIAVIDKEYTLYRKHLNQVVVGKTNSTKTSAKAGGVLAFMSMSKAELKANYTIEYLGQENVSGGTPTWHLKLTPKTAIDYKVAEFWVDGNGMVIQAKAVENNNDSTTVFVSNLQKNVTINAKVFAIDYPKNAKVIKG